MTESDLVGLFVPPVESLGLDCTITGGVASVICGDPRFTRDIDLILEPQEADAGGLLDAFSADDFYRPPLEAMREEIRRPRHGHFNVIHRDTALRADVYLLGDDPLHAWTFERRVRIPLEADLAIWLAPPEYLVVRKLRHAKPLKSQQLAVLRPPTPTPDKPRHHALGAGALWEETRPDGSVFSEA